MTAIQVLIADDHRMFCDALRQALDKEPFIEVVAVTYEGREAVRLARELRPDIVVLDIAMPSLNGMEAARQIAGVCPESKMIALSMHADRRYVTAMLSAGVSGYLVKDCAFEELARAIRAVADGQVYLSPLIAGVVVEGYRGSGEGGAEGEGPRALLSVREREVLQLLVEGCRVADIAHRLCLSVKTVESHRRQVMRKLDIDTVAGLTKYAIREGLTSIDE